MVPTRPKSVAPPEQAPNFIYITGSDGTGKTTQARLLVEHLQKVGAPVQHLWLRFPFLFSYPLLLYARLFGYSYYEEQDGQRQGYWEFHRSWLLHNLFPWVLLLDASLVSLWKVTLPLLLGKVIVCERYTVDMAADLSLALRDPNFHRKLPGRLFYDLMPQSSSVFILDLDYLTLRKRRTDLQLDRKLKRRVENFRRLAADWSLRLVSAKEPVELVQAQILDHLPDAAAFTKIPDITDQLGAVAKKAQRSMLVAVMLHWTFQSMFFMDRTERWFKIGMDALLTLAGTLVLQFVIPWPAAFLLAFLTAHTINFFFNGQLFALLKNYGYVEHTYLEFRDYAQGLASRAMAEPSIQYVALYGSLSRDAWTATSDLDGRILRRPGWINGVRSCWFLMGERTRAMNAGFPLDMYVIDRETTITDRLREDEKLVRLEPGSGTEPVRFSNMSLQPRIFQQLTGVSLEEFEDIYRAVLEQKGDVHMQVKDRRSRHRMGLKDRLLLFLVSTKLGLGLAAAGILFGIHRKTAGRYVKHMRIMLAQNVEDMHFAEQEISRARTKRSLQQAVVDYPALRHFIPFEIRSKINRVKVYDNKETDPVDISDAFSSPQERDQPKVPESRAERKKRKFLLHAANLFTLLFFMVSAYTFLSVLGLNISYQDVWLLYGIELPFALMGAAYFMTLLFSRDLRRDAVITAVFASLMFAIPAAKYAHVYASTIDAAVHYSLMRALATSGFAEGNYYEFTPGMHILVASFAQVTGLNPVTWAKILPSLMGGIVPLSIYMLARRLNFTYLLAKSVVVLSALSLPLLYILQGTAYAAIIIAPLLAFMILSVIGKAHKHRGSVFMILAMLLLVALTMWHSISSLLVPLVFLSSGLVAFLLSLFLIKKQWDIAWLRSISLRFMAFGGVGVAMTLLYWYLYADALWIHFVEHIELLIGVINREHTSGGVLVPERTNILSIPQLLIVFSFYHARDAIMVLFAAIAIGATLLRLRTRRIVSRPIELTFLFTSLYLIFFMIITGTFAVRFATFGYHRLLIYVLIVSPILSGFGLWLAVLFTKKYLKFLPVHLILTGFIAVTFLISAIQFYPYQPLFPRYENEYTDGTTPLQWYHQVNTDYQRYVLDFAYNRLPVHVNLYTDYIKYQQTRLFIGPDARERFRYGPWGTLPPSYVLLHFPGEAGSYSEQAEYRSAEAIQSLYRMEGTSIIYDNGGAFIQFVPEELMPNYTLGGDR
jgi:thymidylate kinase